MKKVLGIFFVILVALMYLPLSIFAQDDGKVSINLYSDEGTDYLTGTTITVYAGLTLSGLEKELVEPYLLVKIPKEYIDTSFYSRNYGLQVSDGNGLSQKPITTADESKDYYEIRYNYNTVKSGTTIALPISFRARNRTTPGGSTISITAELYDKSSKQLLSEVYTINNQTTSNWEGLSTDKSFRETYKSSAENTHSSDDLDKLDSIPIEVKFSNFHHNMGVYLTEPRTLKLQVQLKDNVVFDKEAEINKTWYYDEESRTLTKVVNTKDITIESIIYRQYFAVKAPNFPYKKDISIGVFQLFDADGSTLPNDGSKSNNLNLYLKPLIGYTYRLGIDTLINGQESWPRPVVISYVPKNAEAEVAWQYKIYNNSNSDDPAEKDSSDIKVENIYHKPINNHLYFTGVLIDSQRAQFIDETQKENLKTNILYGKTKDGQKVELARDIPVDQVYRLDEKVQQQVQTSYRELWLEFPKNINLHKPLKEKSDEMYVNFYGKVFPRDWQEAIKENPQYDLATTPLLNETMSERVNVQHFWESEGKKFQGVAWAYGDYEYRSLGGTVTLSNFVYSGENYQLGQVVDYNFDARFEGLALEDEQGNPYDIKDARFVVLLPSGWEYVPSSAENEKYRQLVYDYKGTGKQALIISDPGKRKPMDWWSERVQLKPTSSTPAGKVEIETYLYWENNKKYEFLPSEGYYGATVVADTLDLDNDGNKTEEFLRITRPISYTPPREVIGVQKAGPTLDKLTPLTSAGLDVDDDFYYSFEVLNLQSTEAVRALQALMVLPYVGDKATVADKDGNYRDRQSAYPVRITGSVQYLENGQLIEPKEKGFEVLYSTEEPHTGDLDANLKANFTDSVSDYSKVRMIKIKMRSGETIANKETKQFVVPAKMPNDSSLTRDSLAYMSTAFAASNAMMNQDFTAQGYLESAKVGTPIKFYTITTTVYSDDNRNRQQESTEVGLSNVQVGLFSKTDGTQLATQETDSQGQVHFKLAKRGDYQVQVIGALPNGFRYLQADEVAVEGFPSSNVRKKRALATSPLMEHTVNPTNPDSFSALGVVRDMREIPIKVVFDPEVQNPPSTVEVTLEADNQEKQLTVTQDATYTGEFTDVFSTDVSGQPILYRVTAQEISGTSYTVTGDADNGFTVIYTRQKIEDIPNTAVPKTNNHLSIWLLTIGGMSLLALLLSRIIRKRK